MIMDLLRVLMNHKLISGVYKYIYVYYYKKYFNYFV